MRWPPPSRRPLGRGSSRPYANFDTPATRFAEPSPPRRNAISNFSSGKKGWRATELEVGERAAKAYAPSGAFRALPDYSPFGDVAATIRARILTDLQSLSLARTRREVVYSVGAAEAMLLDRTRPDWKREYFAHPFRLPDE